MILGEYSLAWLAEMTANGINVGTLGMHLMPANSGLRCAIWSLLGTIAAGSMSVASAQELPTAPVQQQQGLIVLAPPSETITLKNGVATPITVGRVFKSIHIGDPNIVDFVPENDHTALLVPKAIGATNIQILDEKSETINSVTVRVTGDEILGRVVVYNGPTLGTFTVYGCAPNCQRFSEEVSKIPAPTPAPPPNNVIVLPSAQQATPPLAR